MGWLSGWSYRKSHTIEQKVGAGTDNPIKIKAAFASDFTLDAIVADIDLERVQFTSILSRGGVGDWDEKNIGAPDIIDDGTQLAMYFLGQNTDGVCAIGRATASRIVEPPTTWVKEGRNPILVKGTSGDWDNCTYGIRMGSIIKIGALYHLYYSSEAGGGFRGQIGVATSSDGINFNKHPSNPIISPNLDAGEYHCAIPYVIESGGTYYCYYTSSTINNFWTPNQLRVAHSVDGINWTKDGVVLSLGAAGTWDDTYIEGCTVYETTDGYLISYSAYTGSIWANGFARNTVPTTPFTKHTQNPIFQKSRVIGSFDQYHVSTPLMYKMGKNLYGFYQGADNTVYSAANWNIGLTKIKNLVTLENHSAIDFGDIRFTDNDGVTELKYWMQEKINSNHAIFSVKLTDDLDIGDATIYIYYGNAVATTISSGVDTFIFFGDFNALNLGDLNGQDGWVAHTAFDVQNTVVKEGAKAVAVSAGAETLSATQSITIESYKVFVELYMRGNNLGTQYPAVMYLMEGANPISALTLAINLKRHLISGGWETIEAALPNVWYKSKLALTSISTHRVWYDNSEKQYQNSNFNNVVTSVNTILLQNYFGNSVGYFDLVIVGKYVDGILHGAWGAEETPPCSVYTTQVTCEAAGCYWCNGVCQSSLCPVSTIIEEVSGELSKPWVYDYTWNHIPSEKVRAIIKRFNFGETKTVKAPFSLLFIETKQIRAKVGNMFSETIPIFSTIIVPFRETKRLISEIEKKFEETCPILATIYSKWFVERLKIFMETKSLERSILDELKRIKSDE